MKSIYHNKVFEYVQKYPKIGDFVTFNGGKATAGAVQLETVEGQRVISQDICGNQRIEYSFLIISYMNYSTVPYSKQNVENMMKVQDFMNWITEQNIARNYPDFEGVTIEKMENAMNIPDVSGYDPKERLAKYMFGVKIIFEKEQEE